MPLQKCVVDGKKGWQWGSEGKCYTGRDAKKQAVKQGIAVEGPEKFSEKAREAGIELSQEEIEAVADWMYDEGYASTAIVATSALLFSYWAKPEKKKKKKDDKKDDSEAKHESGMDPKNYKKGGPVCPKGHVFDKKTEKCVPKNGVEADDKSRRENLERDEYKQDKKELDSETLRERLKHHKDAIKNIEREIKSLEKDKREDKRDVREDSKSAKMTRKAINDLPDSDFAYISPGGKKDASGKTEPRSLRHLPIQDAAHVRNALARLSQTDIPAEAKKSALSKIKARAKKFGIDTADSSEAIYEGCRTTSMVMDRDGYGHFHTFKPGDQYTSKARTGFGDIILGGHIHEIRDGKVLSADGHTHKIEDIGPGQEWFNV
tara:strand:+ start:32394 stop:33521 length:1128 start_codon:yes stop_codon:yes gene_type:complete